MKPVIFHVDVNSAFLSWTAVRRLKEDPKSLDLRTVPSAVGGDVKTRHGVITAKSIPAGRLGIKTGEPVMSALRKCPELILVPSEFATYRKYSKAFLTILKRHTGAVSGSEEGGAAIPVEQVSIDEAFADMTGVRDPLEEAAALRREVRETLGFTVNVGISENRLLAKMASDFEKPDKTHTLWPREIPEKLWPLPIRSLFGCGSATASRLVSFGIRTIGDAAKTPLPVLQAILGDKAGSYISRAANGQGSARVIPVSEDAKSYSNETTTPEDITFQNSAEALPPILRQLSEKVASRMRRDGFTASTIGVLVKTEDFRRHSRQMTLPEFTDDPEKLFRTADRLMHGLLFGEDTSAASVPKTGGDPETPGGGGLFQEGHALRLLGVSASGLSRKQGQYRQMNLFELPVQPEAEIPGAGTPDTEPVEEAALPEPAAKTKEDTTSASSEKESEAPPQTEKRREALQRMMERIQARHGEGAVTKGSPGKENSRDQE